MERERERKRVRVCERKSGRERERKRKRVWGVGCRVQSSACVVTHLNDGSLASK